MAAKKHRSRIARYITDEDPNPFTMKEFLDANRDEGALDPADLAAIRRLKPGESVTLNFGAGGLSTITRMLDEPVTKTQRHLGHDVAHMTDADLAEKKKRELRKIAGASGEERLRHHAHLLAVQREIAKRAQGRGHPPAGKPGTKCAQCKKPITNQPVSFHAKGQPSKHYHAKHAKHHEGVGRPLLFELGRRRGAEVGRARPDYTDLDWLEAQTGEKARYPDTLDFDRGMAEGAL